MLVWSVVAASVLCGGGSASGLVVTELLYHPVGDDPATGDHGLEFIELFNETDAAVDIGGYAFDRGITYTLPAPTVLDRGDYLVIAKDPAAVAGAYQITGVIGGYQGAFSNGGETVRLLDPDGVEVLDFAYGVRGDWPAAADGTGHSLVLNLVTDNPNRARNWHASRLIGGSPGASDDPAGQGPRTVDLVRKGDQGRYFKGTAEPAAGTTAWAAPGFPLSASWRIGPSGFGYSNQDNELQHINTPLPDMRGSYLSVYARMTFILAAEDLEQVAQLIATVAYDDGYVLYLNGARVASTNVNGTPPTSDTPANAARDYSPDRIDLTARIDLLRAGENVLAIQGHNANLGGSSDFVIAPELQAVLVPPPEAGDPARAIVINEILANSDAGADWVELYNPTDAAIDLSGVFISDSAGNLAKDVLGPGTVVPAHGFRELREGRDFDFRLSSGGEALFLTEPTQAYVLAAYAFGPQAPLVSIGRFPDGDRNWYAMDPPTPEVPNARRRTGALVINEFMYHAPNGQADEYVELHNPTAFAVDVSGWGFVGIRYRFPETTIIPADAYVLVADDVAAAAATYGLDPDAVFGDYGGGLSNGGERLTLLDADDIVVDTVRYDDISPWPLTADGLGASLERSCVVDTFDDSDDWRASPLAAPSPGAPNAVSDCAPPTPAFVVINEILYHSYDDADDDRRGQFIELYNTSGGPIDLTGWTIAGEVTYAFGPGTVLPGGEYLVVAWDPGAIAQRYAVPGGAVVGPYAPSLPGGGGLVLLLGADGRAIDTVDYDDDFPWPSAADGFGAIDGRGTSLERRCPTADANDLANWAASPEDQATPGQPNTVLGCRLPATVVALDVTPETVTSTDSPIVRATIAHAGEVSGVWIEFWVDNPQSTREAAKAMLPMTDDGTNGDAQAGDDEWAVTLPARPNNAIVRYRILLDIGAGQVVASPRPDGDVYDWHAYFVDPMIQTDMPAIYHLFLSSGNWSQLHINTSRGRVVNGRFYEPWNGEVPAMFVAGGVVYDVTVRHQGSRYRRTSGSFTSFPCPSHTSGQAQRRNWRIRFPSYRKPKGNKIMILQRTEAQGQLGWPQRIGFMMFRMAGVPAPRLSWADFYINGCSYIPASVEVERPGTDMMRRWVDEMGDLFKSRGFGGVEGPFERGDGRQLNGTVNGYTNAERYKWTYDRKTRSWVSSPYERDVDVMQTLIAGLHAARGRGTTALRAYLAENFDVETTLKYLATINYGSPWDDVIHNHFYYRKADGKWIMMPWDLDNTMGTGGGSPVDGSLWRGASTATEPDNNGAIQFFKDSLMQAYKQEYIDTMWDLNNNVYPPSVLHPLIDESAAVRRITNSSLHRNLKSFVTTRHDIINARLATRISGEPGDFDRDGDQDLADFLFLMHCFSGAGVQPDAIDCCTNRRTRGPCDSPADFDHDDDVDLADVIAFQSVFTGAR